MSVILNIKRPCMQLPLSTRAVPAVDDPCTTINEGRNWSRLQTGREWSSILILLGGDLFMAFISPPLHAL